MSALTRTVMTGIYLLAIATLRGQSADDCVNGIANGDSLAFVSLPTEAMVNVDSNNHNVYAVIPQTSPWSLFYVWTRQPFKNGALDLDLQSQMVGNSPDDGHVGTVQPAFRSVYLNADQSWGTYIQMESWDYKCQFYLRELVTNKLLGPDPTTGRLESGNSNRFRLAFRYRPESSSQSFTLSPGDVALYSKPNYAGNAWILRMWSTVLSNFVNVAGLFRTAQSVQFGVDPEAGPTVGVVASTGGNGSGSSGAFAYNVPNLKSDPNPNISSLNQAMASMAIYPLDQFITTTNSCINCDLRHFAFQQEKSGMSFKGLNLSGANLDGADLTGVDFTGTNFTGASLRKVTVSNTTNFTQARFEKAVLSGTDLRGSILSGAHLMHAVLQNVILTGVDLTPLCSSEGLAGTDLTGAQLQNVNLACSGNGFQFDGATLSCNGPSSAPICTNLSNASATGSHWDHATITNAIFFGATLSQSRFDGATIACASFAGADVGTARLDSAQFVTTGCPKSSTYSDFSNATVTFNPRDLSISGIRVSVWPTAVILNYAKFIGLSCSPAFSKANLAWAQLEGFTLADGCQSLQNVNLANADLANSHLNGANFTGAQTSLSSATLSGAKLQNANFTGANLSGAIFTASTNLQAAAANLQGATLTNANLTQAKLAGADLQNVTMIGQSDSPVSLSGATLSNVNFTGAFLYHVNASNQQGLVTANGVNFGCATVVDVDFSGANLSSSSDVTTFSKAILYGSTFSNAAVSQVTFLGALLSKQAGAAKLPLPNGTSMEVEYKASQPPADNSVTCPDGSSGPSCNWYLSTQPPLCSNSRR